MKVKGTITISRVQSSHEDDYIEVRLVDEDAAISFAETKISMKNWGEAVSGRGYVECEIEVRGLDRIGTSHEVKVMIIPLEFDYTPSGRAKALKTMKAFEVDGWVGRESDLFNLHRRVGDCVSVTFDRNVNK